MRRDIGMILAGLGAFLIVIAVALPTYISGHVLKFPLNYYYVATLNGPNTTYVSPATGKQTTGNVQAIYTLKGGAAADKGNSTTAVWQVFTYVHDTAFPGHSGDIQITQRTFAFDRKTAELRNCCGHNIGGKAVNESGVVGYVFPMGTQPKTYDVFDTSLLKAVPFAYAGTDSVDGVKTYKFTENVAPTKIGFSPLSSTDPEFYAINLTYWVDPDTGALLKVVEHQQQFLENAITGARTVTLFDGTLSPTAKSVADIVAIDNSGRLKITLLQTVLPIVGGVLGAILLIFGILLVRQRRDIAESGFEAMTRELAAAAPPRDEQGASKISTSSPKHAAESSGIIPGFDRKPKTPEQESSEPADGPATG